MTAISGTTSADLSASSRRNDQVAQAAQARETQAQERKERTETERTAVPQEAERREARKIPGLGNAVDITA
ncbi:MAG: hypothetical protein ACK4K8_01695 [Pannonibacter sp.]